MGVDRRLLGELESMGFSEALATKALFSSGNSSIEDAVNWLVDNGSSDTAVNGPLMQPQALVDISIEAFNPVYIPEQVKLKAQALRNQARMKKAKQEKILLEREREKERIRAGKELLEAKRVAEESERKRKAEKEEERRARDRLERRGILGLPREAPVPLKPDALPERTKNLKQVGHAFPPAIKRAAVRDDLSECLRSIKRQNKDENTKAVRAFQTLMIYVRNIINHPNEEKFRKIRISNPVFQERVGKFEEGIKFLELCGFERVERDKFLLLPQEKVDLSVLKLAASELHNALMNPFFGLLSG
ncbi:UBX domain-containing protein 6 [Phtheirospermum japonicum]|uniref:UBX domain-containing protein 6 n=1 Tax=Phtheirospermum japonicum TaxID=374723 RepID=A0A830D2P0_9LAMI|nr:UBX domain-containing protein 6 [Phtheirospermum japonicum]